MPISSRSRFRFFSVFFFSPFILRTTCMQILFFCCLQYPFNYEISILNMYDGYSCMVCVQSARAICKKKIVFEKENRKKRILLMFFSLFENAKKHFQSVRAWVVSIVYKYTFNRFSNECVMHLCCIFHACWKRGLV